MAVPRFLCLVLLAVLSARAAAMAQDGSEYGERIQAFLARPDQMKLQSPLLSRAWGSSAGACEAIQVSKEVLIFLGPITFDDQGTPLSGSWKHTLTATGCGVSRTLNLFYIADGAGKVNRFPGAPGSTRADPVLQRDSIRYLLAGASAQVPKDCKQIQLIDTEYLGPEADPLPGVKDSPWHEYWTVRGCGVSARVTMHFSPDATGTAINVKPEETKRVEVR
jgi:hypothetical protein